MQIINLHKIKEYTDKHKTDRNEWVSGAIDSVLCGSHVITYKRTDGFKVIIDREYIQGQMQSTENFDAVLSKALDTLDVAPLLELERKQAILIIGELADDFEIGE